MRQDGLVRITVGSDELTANTSIAQSVVVLPDGRTKDGKLLETLRQHGKKDKALVFALYKKEAARVHAFLRGKGYDAVCIQGDLSQEARTRALEAFRSGESQLLVATDVACRGLDVPLVELVVKCARSYLLCS
jgi:ATP-dependent RNA helicase DBP3